MARPTNVKIKFDTTQGKTLVATWEWDVAHTSSFNVIWWYADEHEMWNMKAYHKMDPVSVAAKTSTPTGSYVTVLTDGACVWTGTEDDATIIESEAFGTDLEFVSLSEQYYLVRLPDGTTGYINSSWCTGVKTAYKDADRKSTFSIPEHAARVWVYITPISETYTVNSTDSEGNQLNSAEVYYWVGEASTGVGIWTTNLVEPATPSAPTLTMGTDAISMTAVLNGFDTLPVATSPDKRQQVLFVIYESENGIPGKQVDHATVSVTTSTASFQSKAVTAGMSYIARAKIGIYYNTALASNGDWNAEAYQLWWGEWGPFSEEVTAKPGAFSMKDARAQSSTSAEVSWEACAGADSYELYYSTGTDDVSGHDILKNPEKYNSSYYTSISGISKDTTKYVVGGLSSGNEYFFRAKAVNNTGENWAGNNANRGSGFISNRLGGKTYWATQDTASIVNCVIGSTPTAPTTWSYVCTVALGEKVNLFFTHNSTDNSKCYSYKIHYKVTDYDGTIIEEFDKQVGSITYASDDEEQNIVEATLDTSRWTKDVVVTWKVATTGITRVFSPWSIERTINVYKKPTLATKLSTPGHTHEDGGAVHVIGGFPIQMDVSIDAGIQYPTAITMTVVNLSAYTTLNHLGEKVTVPQYTQLYVQNIYNNWAAGKKSYATFKIMPMDISLKNDMYYRFDLSAAMSSGLTAKKTYTIHTSWADTQMFPSASIGVNTSLYCAYIRPKCYDRHGNVMKDVMLSVYRREYDDSFAEVATGIRGGNKTTVTDPHPALNFARYRIVTISDATGEVAYFDTQNFKVGIHAIVIQWDDDWSDFNIVNGASSDQPWNGSMLVLPYNIDTSDSTSPDASLVEYAGRKHPVSYYGTHLGTTSRWSTEIPKKDLDTLYQIRRLQAYMGDVYVREPTGVGYWANIVVDYNITHCELTIPVTFTIKRVEAPVSKAKRIENSTFVKSSSIDYVGRTLSSI